MKGWIITYNSSEGVYVYTGGTPKFGSKSEKEAVVFSTRKKAWKALRGYIAKRMYKTHFKTKPIWKNIL